MADLPTVYADDPDAAWTWEVTDANGANLDWASPVAAIGPGTYTVVATWLGNPAPTRQIRVPLTGLTGGTRHAVYLRVPGGNDIQLGHVHVRARR